MVSKAWTKVFKNIFPFKVKFKKENDVQLKNLIMQWKVLQKTLKMKYWVFDFVKCINNYEVPNS